MQISIRISLLFAVLLSALALLSGCSGVEDESEKFVSVDLIPLYSVADKNSDSGIVNFTSFLKPYYLMSGWSEPLSLSEGQADTIAAIGSRSVLRFRVLNPGDRRVSFTIGLQGPFGSLTEQELEISCSGRTLGSFQITGGEQQILSTLIPAGLLQVGANELHFRFSGFVANPDFDVDRYKRFVAQAQDVEQSQRQFENPYPGIAAYLSDLRIAVLGRDGQPSRLVRDENRVFRLVADSRYLSQSCGSELSYAFEIKPGARLTAGGSVQLLSDEKSDIAISIHGRSGGSREWSELWSRKFSQLSRSPQSFETKLALEDPAGEAAELRLSVSSSNDFADAAVTWKRLALEIPREHAEAESTESRESVRLGSGIRNVVIIVLDAARPDHFGCYGDERGLTPNIDEFADGAVVFSNVVTAAPYTVASVATLFSGVRPERHGILRLLGREFPEDLESMPRAFKRSGYYTVAMAGLPFLRRKYGHTREMDKLLYLRVDPKGDNSTMDIDVMAQGIEAAAGSNKPAFVYVHLLPPHWPYNPPPPFNERFTDGRIVTNTDLEEARRRLDQEELSEGHPVRELHRSYMNNMVYADHLVGRLLDLLRRFEMFDDSLILIMADHGEALGELGLLGHGTALSEEMIRVPLIVRAPDQAHRKVDQLVGLIDIFPTLVELLDLQVEGAVFDGRSIAPLLTGAGDVAARYYYSRAFSPSLFFCMRGLHFKYVFNDYHESLFDLDNSNGERENAIVDHPALAASLRQRGLLLISRAAARRSGEAEDVPLSEDEERELRNLGYIQ